MKAKIYVVWIALVTSLSLCAQTSGTCGPNLTWTLQDSVLTISGTGQMSDFSYSGAPWPLRTIKRVVIGDSVTSIEKNAFRECHALSSISLGNGITKIGYQAFEYCTSLTSIVFPNSLKRIDEFAFDGCTGLTSITIPSSVDTIGFNPFEDCYGLESIFVDANNTKYDSRNNCNAIIETATNKLITGCKNTIIPNTVTEIGVLAFANCIGLTSITIPSSVDSIRNLAFVGCTGVTSITIPSSVDCIGSGAFERVPNIVYYGTAKGSPWGAKSVNGYVDGLFVFENYAKTILVACSGAATDSVAIPKGVITIRSEAFENCSSITALSIPNSATTIESSAFQFCSNITNLAIGDSVSTIGNQAFAGCSGLTSITIPKMVTNIGDYAFQNCTQLQQIHVEAVTPPTIYLGTFANVDRNIPVYVPFASVVAYRAANYWNAFNIPANGNGTCGDNLNWALVDSVLTISGSGAMTVWGHKEDVPWYAQQSLITQITIGDSVTSVSNFAFSECSNLKSVHVGAPIPPTVSSALFATVVPVYVPDASVAAYQAANYWKDCPIVGNFSGYGGMCGNNAGWALNDSVLIISGRGNMADYKTSADVPWQGQKKSVKTVVVGDAITGIGNYTFEKCSNLDSIHFGTAVTRVGKNAFAKCTELTSLIIPNAVASIGEYAFDSCSAMSSIQLNGAITSIEKYTFHDCVSLKSFVVPNSVKNIGEGAFSGCTGLKTLVMGESVEFIGNYVFSSCNNLDTMYMLPLVPPSLGNYSLPSKAVYVMTNCGYDRYYSTNSTFPWYPYRNSLYEPIINLNLTLENNNPGLGSVRIIKVRDREIRCDSTAVIQAIPKEGCAFEGWSNGSHNLLDTVYLVSDSTITASFSGNPSPHLVTFVVSPADSCGSIFIGDTIAKDSIYEDGKKLKLVAVPAEGYILDYWSTGANTDSIRVTVDSTMTVTAYFVPASWGKTKQGTCGDNLTWALSNGVLKISGEGALADYATSGENLAPWFQDSIASLIIGDSVTTIGKCAFSGCEYLTSVTIPTSVTTIQESAFSRCIRMKEVFFGDSVQKILNYAFSGCTELDTIYMMPPTPPSVGNSALPTNASMVIILKGCDAFNVYTANSAGAFKDPNLYRRYLRDPIVDLKLIVESDNIRKGSVEIIPFEEHNNVLIRCDSTAVIKATPKPGCRFDHWSDGATDTLHTVQLVSDSTIITAFFEGERDSLWVEFLTRCSTDSVDSCGFIYLGDTIAKSGLYKDSTVLNLVAKPDSGYIFDYWSTGDTTASISLTVDSAMTLTAYFTHKSWGRTKRGMCGDSLTWTLSNAVLTISGHGAMYNYETAGDKMLPWYLDSITSIVIGDSVTVIGKNAFNSCSYVRSAVIPTSVVRIQEQAFSRCDSLRTIIISDSVKAIGNYAFSGCNMLDTIYMMPPTPPSLGSYSIPNQAKIILKGCSYDEYQAAVDSLASWKPYEKALRDPIINFNFSVELEDSLLEQGTIRIDTIHNGTVIRCDSTVVIEAIPKNGCKFERWSNGRTYNPDTLKLVGDDTIRAIFSGTPKPIFYRVNFNTNPVDGGNIHLGDSLAVSGDFEKGQTLNLEAVPANGYIFSHWNNGTMVNKTSLRVTTDSTVTAMFLMIPHDTIEVHDTTIVKDTINMPVPVYVHDTSYITIHDTTITIIHDTAYVTEYVDVHDTTFIPVHDTTTIHVHDTTVVHFHDTTTLVVYDTTYVTEYVNIHDTTTIFIHDTTYVTEYITLHDTTVVTQYVDVHDTTFIHVHDTTIVNIHDTTTLIIRDTTFVPYPVYDTIYVTEFVHDTTLVQVHDTSFIPIEVHDTMYVQVELRDTMFVPFPVHDTTYVTEYVYVRDTTVLPIEVIVHDTMYVTEYITDTIWMTRFDTIYIRDTIYINDTMPTNASQVEYINVKVYASYGQIVVEGANGRLVTLYSASGQLMAKKQDEDDLLYFDVPTSGSYLVKIGNVAVKQIVVKK